MAIKAGNISSYSSLSARTQPRGPDPSWAAKIRSVMTGMDRHKKKKEKRVGLGWWTSFVCDNSKKKNIDIQIVKKKKEILKKKNIFSNYMHYCNKTLEFETVSPEKSVVCI